MNICCRISLGFSVALYCGLAAVAIVVLLLRRSKAVGGELGGPMKYRIPTSLLFLLCWLIFVLVYSLQVYGYINADL